MTLRCEEVEELAGAYALYALSPEEQSEAETHLTACQRHPLVARLSAAAQSLAVLSEEREPPPALKTRLMEAIRAEAAPRPPAAEVRRPRGEPRGWRRRLFASPLPGYGLAAALGVVVAILLLAGDNNGDQGLVIREFSNASGRVVYIPDQDLAVMEVDGLDAAAPDQSYQAWLIDDGRAASLGVLHVDERGRVSEVIRDVELSGGHVIAVTLEPFGGSEQPTADPLFTVTI